jgi:hypothetical protein
MSNPSPFQIGREVGNNLGNAFSRVRDENAIERILSDAMGTGDAEVIQNSIGKILSQVSPERQGLALQHLQNVYANVQKKNLESTQKQAAQEGGYTYGAPSAVQAAQVKNQVPKPVGGLSGQAVPPQISEAIEKTIKENPEATADQLSLAFDKLGVPRTFSNSYIENRRRTEEQRAKTGESKKETLRKETLPIRQDLAKKAEASRKGIQNKEQLLNIIRRGNINDPTYAALAEALPLNLGKRLLSNDTTEYKAGLVEEFTDLRNIFQGQTRIKEIDLLENKIADLYLNDEQKESVIKSRLNALKADLIRAEAAAELEDREDLGVLQFEKEVEKIAKPRLDGLFNSILDEQKSIIDSAERKKGIALDPNDPDDKQILMQILQEAKGDKVKARKIATEKGYKF